MTLRDTLKNPTTSGIVPKSEKQVFEKAPKSCPKAKAEAKKGEKEKDELVNETKDKMRRADLYRALKVPKEHRFSKAALHRLLKHDVGSKFVFEGNSIVMTAKLQRLLKAYT